MKRYLVTLHKKPDHHKKQFAFLVSSTITLIIFGVWSLATFPPLRLADQPVLAGGKNNASNASEVSPFQSLKMSLADTLSALKSSIGELKTSFESADLEAQYKELRNNSLNIYDR